MGGTPGIPSRDIPSRSSDPTTSETGGQGNLPEAHPLAPDGSEAAPPDSAAVREAARAAAHALDLASPSRSPLSLTARAVETSIDFSASAAAAAFFNTPVTAQGHDVETLRTAFEHYQTLYGLSPEGHEELATRPAAAHSDYLRRLATPCFNHRSESPDFAGRMEIDRTVARVNSELLAREGNSADRGALAATLEAWLEELVSHPVAAATTIEALGEIAALARRHHLEEIISGPLLDAVQSQVDEWRHIDTDDSNAAVQARQQAFLLLLAVHEALGEVGSDLFQDVLDELEQDATRMESGLSAATPEQRIQSLGEIAALYRQLSQHPEAGEHYRGRWRQSLEAIVAEANEDSLDPQLSLQVILQVVGELEAGGETARAEALRHDLLDRAAQALERGRRARAPVLECYRELLASFSIYHELGDVEGRERAALSLRRFLTQMQNQAAHVDEPAVSREVGALSIEAYLRLGEFSAAERMVRELRDGLPTGADSAETMDTEVLGGWLLRLAGYAQQMAVLASESTASETDFSLFGDLLETLSQTGAARGHRTMELYGIYMRAVVAGDPAAETLYQELQNWRPHGGAGSHARPADEADGHQVPSLPFFDTVSAYEPDSFQEMAVQIHDGSRPMEVAARAGSTLQCLTLLIESNYESQIAAVEDEGHSSTALREERDEMRRYLSFVQDTLLSGRAASTREAIELLPETVGNAEAARCFYRNLGYALEYTDLLDGTRHSQTDLISRLISSEEIDDSNLRAQAWLSLARELVVQDSLTHRCDALVGVLLQMAEESGAVGRAPRSLSEILSSMAVGDPNLDDWSELYNRVAGNETLRDQIEAARAVTPYIQTMHGVIDSVFSVEGGVILLASIFTAGFAAQLAGAAMLARLGQGALVAGRLTWAARFAVGATRMGAAFVARSTTELGGISIYRAAIGRREMTYEETRLRLITSLFCSVGDELATHLTRAILSRPLNAAFGETTRGLARTHATIEVAEFFTSGLGEMWGETVGTMVAGGPVDDRPFLVRYFEETVHGSFFVVGTRAAAPFTEAIHEYSQPAESAPLPHPEAPEPSGDFEAGIPVELEVNPNTGVRPRRGSLVPGLIGSGGNAQIRHYRVRRLFQSGGRALVEVESLHSGVLATCSALASLTMGRLEVGQELSFIPAIEGGSGRRDSDSSEAESIPASLQNLEAAQIPLQEHLATVEAEVARLNDRLDSLVGRVADDAIAAYRREIAKLQRRLDFWLEQQLLLEREPPDMRRRFARDIETGQALLLDRSLRLAAQIFAEPMDAGSLSGQRLRQVWRIPSPRPAGGESSARDALPALVNRDVGFGRDLALRPHQEEALLAVRGWLSSQAERIAAGAPVLPDFLQATLVMPVGGGKTRTMVAAFAETIRQGFFQADRGDKLILLNHTTQIHEQNLEVVRRLGSYFQQTFGRPLRVGEVKAESRDLSGDVVVVSIPSVPDAERRETFARQLRQALGDSGRIAMVAVDEVHHLELGRASGRETWSELLQTLREVFPNFFRLGFTATPTGREGRVLYRLREAELMRAGVTPRTYLVKVEGVDLSRLRVSQATGDFLARELGSTLLEHPERNRRILATLEARALRSEASSPSRRERMEGTIVFAADLQHARILSEAHARHFGGAGEGLCNRRIHSLGLERGRISARELQRALQAYRNGEVDAVTAIVSGETQVREEILRAVERGEIEAVFTVDALVEGADLHMFRNQVGARPTFSRIKRAQERGRINRRGPEETDARGRLVQDPPRVLFDVVDRYDSLDRHLVRYGDVMGLRGHVLLREGELYDALGEAVVGEIDRGGQNVRRNHPAPRPRPQGPTRDAESPWTPLVRILEEVLDSRYHGDLEQMAMDLGEEADFVAGLLAGRGWENNQWFLRRLGTLLYQERDHLLNAHLDSGGRRDERVSEMELQLLREALAFHSEVEGSARVPEAVGSRSAVSSHALGQLQRGTLGLPNFLELWVNLAGYCSEQVSNQGLRPEWRERANELLVRLLAARREALGWGEHSGGAREILRDWARELVIFRFGGILPNNAGIDGVPLYSSGSPLTRWLSGEAIRYSGPLNPESFYFQVRALLTGLGLPAEATESLIETAIFEERGWTREAATAGERLLLAVRRRVALRFGGALPKEFRINGVSKYATTRSSLTRWLSGEAIRYSRQLNPAMIYPQVRSLLIGLGATAEATESLIEAAIFEERGWSLEAATAGERLLLAVRRRVAMRFGGALPLEPGIDGVSVQSSGSPLTRWLSGEAIRYSNNLNPESFYFQVRALLTGLGLPAEATESLIEAAIFEERGWSLEAATAGERLLLAARRRVAVRFGGALPHDIGIDGVPQQRSGGPFTRWLSGGAIRYSRHLNPESFYSQVRALLTGLGLPAEATESLIEAAIFEERGWSLEASTVGERLLLAARRRVAMRFGGGLPLEPGIDGVSVQNSGSPLTRWLSGGAIRYSPKLNPESFYSQVRALLTGLGLPATQADSLIEAARREADSHSDGDEGEAQGFLDDQEADSEREEESASEEEAIDVEPGTVSSGGVYSLRLGGGALVPGLLARLGNPRIEHFRVLRLFQSEGREIIDLEPLSEGGRETRFTVAPYATGRLQVGQEVSFIPAVEGGSGSRPKDNSADASRKVQAPVGQVTLRAVAKVLVFLRWGDSLPNKTNIDGLPRQHSKAALTRWLTGEAIEYSPSLTPNAFYTQVRSLLNGLGLAESETEGLIEAAIFEERNWPREASTAQERLLLETRRRVALRFGGVLPNITGIDTRSQKNSRTPLSRWLAGEVIQYITIQSTQEFYGEVRSLLNGLGLTKSETEGLIEAAVFEEHERREVSKAQGRLLLETRRHVSAVTHEVPVLGGREALRAATKNLVSLRWGDGLPQRTNIEGVSENILNRWLAGEAIRYSRQLPSHAFYRQVRTLLRALGLSEIDIENLVEAAVFEERGWTATAETAGEDLLLAARRGVARRFSGTLPAYPPIAGVSSPTQRAALGRWLEGPSAQDDQALPSGNLFNQVTSLLRGIGLSETDAEGLIEAAVFEERGWATTAESAGERLLLEVRSGVARRFGGILPNQSGIPGVHSTNSDSLFARWLAGENIEFQPLPRHTRQTFYGQIRHLLLSFEIVGTQADAWVQAARRETEAGVSVELEHQGQTPSRGGLESGGNPGAIVALLAAGAGTATLLAADTAHAAFEVAGQDGTYLGMALGLGVAVGGVFGWGWGLVQSAAGRISELFVTARHEATCTPEQERALREAAQAEARLGDEDPVVRTDAVGSLGDIVPHLAAADRLARALHIEARLGDEDSVVRANAIWVLGDIVPHLAAADCLALALHIEARLGDEDSVVRGATVSALGFIVPHLAAADRLARALHIEARLGDEVSRVRHYAVRALRSIVPHLAAADRLARALHIEARLGDKASGVRGAAVWALHAIIPHLAPRDRLVLLAETFSRHHGAMGSSNSESFEAVALLLNKITPEALAGFAKVREDENLLALSRYHAAHLPFDSYFWKAYRNAPDPAHYLEATVREVETCRRGRPISDVNDERELHLAFAGLDSPEGLSFEQFSREIRQDGAPPPPFLTQGFRAPVHLARSLHQRLDKGKLRQALQALEAVREAETFSNFLTQLIQRENGALRRVRPALEAAFPNGLAGLSLEELLAGARALLPQLRDRLQEPSVQGLAVQLALFLAWHREGAESLREKMAAVRGENIPSDTLWAGFQATEEFYRDTVEDVLRGAGLAGDDLPSIRKQRRLLAAELERAREGSSETTEVEFLPSSNRADRFFGYVGEDCTKKSGDAIHRKDFQVYRMVAAGRLVGELYLQRATLGGRRVLVMAIQPRSFWEVEHGDLLRTIEKNFSRIAATAGYDAVLLMNKGGQQSNRQDMLNAITQRAYPTRSFGERIFKGVFNGNEFLAMWERGAAGNTPDRGGDEGRGGSGAALTALLAAGAGAAILLSSEVAQASVHVAASESSGVPSMLSGLAIVLGVGAMAMTFQARKRRWTGTKVYGISHSGSEVEYRYVEDILQQARAQGALRIGLEITREDFHSDDLFARYGRLAKQFGMKLIALETSADDLRLMQLSDAKGYLQDDGTFHREMIEEDIQSLEESIEALNAEVEDWDSDDADEIWVIRRRKNLRLESLRQVQALFESLNWDVDRWIQAWSAAVDRTDREMLEIIEREAPDIVLIGKNHAAALPPSEGLEILNVAADYDAFFRPLPSQNPMSSQPVMSALRSSGASDLAQPYLHELLQSLLPEQGLSESLSQQILREAAELEPDLVPLIFRAFTAFSDSRRNTLLYYFIPHLDGRFLKMSTTEARGRAEEALRQAIHRVRISSDPAEAPHWENVPLAELPRRLLEWGYAVHRRAFAAHQPTFHNLLQLSEKIDQGQSLSEVELGYLRELHGRIREEHGRFFKPLKSLDQIENPAFSQLSLIRHDLPHRGAIWNNLDYAVSRLQQGKAINHAVKLLFAQSSERLLHYAFNEGILFATGEIPQGLFPVDMSEAARDLLFTVNFVRDREVSGKLSDILANFLTNAWRYRSSDRPKINISPVRRSDDSLEITVSDNGIGIQSENLDQLGEMGFREARREVAGSHGFGIASVIQNLRDLDWGPLWVRSTPGQGSQFRIVIPASELSWLQTRAGSGQEISSSDYASQYREEGFVIPRAASSQLAHVPPTFDSEENGSSGALAALLAAGAGAATLLAADTAHAAFEVAGQDGTSLGMALGLGVAVGGVFGWGRELFQSAVDWISELGVSTRCEATIRVSLPKALHEPKDYRSVVPQIEIQGMTSKIIEAWSRGEFPHSIHLVLGQELQLGENRLPSGAILEVSVDRRLVSIKGPLDGELDTLSFPFTFQGHLYPEVLLIQFRDTGELHFLRLEGDPQLPGITGERVDHLFFHPNGSLSQAQVTHGIVQGLPCEGEVLFHENGLLKALTLREDVTIRGIAFRAGNRLFFNEDHTGIRLMEGAGPPLRIRDISYEITTPDGKVADSVQVYFLPDAGWIQIIPQRGEAAVQYFDQNRGTFHRGKPASESGGANSSRRDRGGNNGGGAIAALLAAGAGTATLLSTDVAHAAFEVVGNGESSSLGMTLGLSFAAAGIFSWLTRGSRRLLRWGEPGSVEAGESQGTPPEDSPFRGNRGALPTQLAEMRQGINREPDETRRAALLANTFYLPTK